VTRILQRKKESGEEKGDSKKMERKSTTKLQSVESSLKEIEKQSTIVGDEVFSSTSDNITLQSAAQETRY
jgi:hypothetical protein